MILTTMAERRYFVLPTLLNGAGIQLIYATKYDKNTVFYSCAARYIALLTLDCPQYYRTERCRTICLLGA
jgi:hypothetical protein